MHFFQTILQVLAAICLIAQWVVPARFTLTWGTASVLLGIVLLVLDGWSWPLLFPFGTAALAFVISWFEKPWFEKHPMTLAELNERDKSRGN